MWAKARKPLIIGVLVVLALSYYIYLTHKPVNNKEKPVELTPVTTITTRDMNTNYPTIPSQVVSLFADIQKLWYKQTLSEDEFKSLAEHARAMFDVELLAYNDFAGYTERLKLEIDSYKKANRYILSYEVGETKFKSLNGESYAIVQVKYYLISGKNPVTVNEEYVLRKDSNSKWKIVYWEEIKDTSGGK